MTLTLFAAGLLALSQTGNPPGEPIRYFVATDGNDAWSGRLPAPKPDRSDGPFATPGRARDAIRALKRSASGALQGPVTVAIRGGRYALSKPFVLTPEDSGTERVSDHIRRLSGRNARAERRPDDRGLGERCRQRPAVLGR